ncbi:MAG: thiamine phosphate synthase [Candidatus Acidiferrales bacterium]
MRLVLPKLYVILDAALLTTPEIDCARQLAEAGVRLLQYRDKKAPARELLRVSRELAGLLVPLGVSFLVNDRPDVVFLSGASGVHVGQEDLDVEQARVVAGPGKWVGVSTHNLGQFRAAARTSADYIAVGPIFPTSTKANPDPVVGAEFIRQVRTLTDKAIVAIGGITLERAAGVIEAGADAVAVGSDILRAADPGKRARQYIAMLEEANHAAAV